MRAEAWCTSTQRTKRCIAPAINCVFLQLVKGSVCVTHQHYTPASVFTDPVCTVYSTPPRVVLPTCATQPSRPSSLIAMVRALVQRSL